MMYLIRRVPIMGMLCGNAIAGVTMSLSYVLKELEYVLSCSAPPRLTILCL